MLINQDFTQDRTEYIGGSDIGAILGLSKFRTPLEVWMEKTGKEVRKLDSLPLRFGSFAEEFVASEYARATGFELLQDESIYIHPTHPMMSAHIDRFVLVSNMGNAVADQQDKLPTRILECKTANPFARSEWGEPGTDQVPMGYLCQCLWYMAITGIEQCDLAVLLGNSDFRIYEIERDLELEALVIEKALHFWHEYVLKDIAPPAQTEGDYQALFQKSDPTKIVEASPLIVDELRKVAPLQAQMEATENELSHIKQLLMSSMQDAEILRFQGKTLATWKLAKATKRLDIKSLEKDHPQLVSQYQMISPGSRRFLLKSLEN